MSSSIEIPVEIRDAMRQLSHACKSAGVSLAICVAKYGDDADFACELTLCPVPEHGVRSDHVMMDMIRELSGEWSRQAHVLEPWSQITA